MGEAPPTSTPPSEVPLTITPPGDAPAVCAPPTITPPRLDVNELLGVPIPPRLLGPILAAWWTPAQHASGRISRIIGAAGKPACPHTSKRILPKHRSANRAGLECSPCGRRAEPASQHCRAGSETADTLRAACKHRAKGPADGRKRLRYGRGHRMRDSEICRNGDLAIAIIGGWGSAKRPAGHQPQHSGRRENPV